jgi:hypothetical protein
MLTFGRSADPELDAAVGSKVGSAGVVGKPAVVDVTLLVLETSTLAGGGAGKKHDLIAAAGRITKIKIAAARDLPDELLLVRRRRLLRRVMIFRISCGLGAELLAPC